MSSNIVSGEPYLCDYHRDTLEHAVCAVCPVCAGKERSELTLNAIDNYDRAEKAEARVKELESEDWCRTAIEYQARVKKLELALSDKMKCMMFIRDNGHTEDYMKYAKKMGYK